jgi:hypothetical protein
MRRLLTLGTLLAATASAGGPLAPTRASKVVTLATTSACGVVGAQVDTRVLPDSTTEPFVIPSGQVLVLTGIEWSFNVDPGEGGLIDVLLDVPGPGGLNTVFQAAAPAPGNGIGRGSAAMPNVVVRPGVQICVHAPFGSHDEVLHGFLAKDK